jgi:hypothetical protein
MTMVLPHQVGGPLPDKVEAVAGIWADGETFGQEVWLKRLLDHRAAMTSAYEQAISLLQQGLDQNWTSNQYLAALNSKPNSLPFYSIRSTVEANSKLSENQRPLQHAMQHLLAYFTQNLAVLHQAKPSGSVPEAPQPAPGPDPSALNESLRISIQDATPGTRQGIRCYQRPWFFTRVLYAG